MSGDKKEIALVVILVLVIAGILAYIIWRNRKKLIALFGMYFHKRRTELNQPDYENCLQDPNTTNSYKRASGSSENLTGVYTLAKITNNNPSFSRNDSRRMKQDDTANLIAGADDAGALNVDHIYTEPNATATRAFEEDDFDDASEALPSYDEPEVKVHGTGEIVVRTVTPTYSRQMPIGQTSPEVYHELEPCFEHGALGGGTFACVEHGAHGGGTLTTKINNAAVRSYSTVRAKKTSRPSTKQLTMYSSLGRRPKISVGNEYDAPQLEEGLDECHSEETL